MSEKIYPTNDQNSKKFLIFNCFGGSSQAKTEELKTWFELERLKELKDRVQTIEMEGTQDRVQAFALKIESCLKQEE